MSEKITKGQAIFIVVAVFGIMWFTMSGNDTETTAPAPTDIATLQPGNCESKTVLASTPTNYRAFIETQIAGDSAEYMRMLKSKQLQLVDNCQIVVVTRFATGLREVKFNGTTGWTATENLTK